MTYTDTSARVPPAADRSEGSPRPPTRAVDVLLADGRIATIRSLVAEDEPALLRLHENADEDSIRLRFFVANRATARAYAENLVRADPSTVLALVAAVGEDLLGVAAAEILDEESADVAFLVDSRAQGSGVGTLLLEHLAAEAYDRGVRRFLAEVLTENIAMLRVFRDAGFGYRLSVDRGVVSVELDTAATPVAVAAADEREAAAEARSLRPVLDPRSVAVVGVRHDGTGVGHAIWTSLRQGYTGTLHLVHPDLEQLDGVTAHRTLRDVPAPVDLVIIAVPAPAVAGVLADAAAVGAGAAVVLSAGFSELGGAGAKMQRDILTTARRNNLRIIGPNCMGVMNTDPAVELDATFATVRPDPGGLAVASQSGGVGIALLESARRSGLGISQFVSLGNKVDVSGNDLLSAWLDDSRVTAAAFYLESFGNAVKFARLARRFALRRPLLAIVGGRSAGGIRAGASHTAAAAASGIGVEALFDQAGVIGCDSIDDMVATARLLDRHPLPAGDRLGIIGNAGGLGVLAADAADRQGLAVPKLSPATAASLAAALGAAAPMNGNATANPVDLGAGVTPDGFAAAVAALTDSDEVDAVLIILAATAVTDPQAVLDGLAARYADGAAKKPVLLVAYGIGDCRVPELLTRTADAEEACLALAHAVGYQRWRDGAGPDTAAIDTGPTPAGPVADTVPETGRAMAASYLALPEVIARDGWLDADQSADLLQPYGIPVLGSRRVDDADAAVRAAGRLGYPVVIKAADPAIVHKSDRGLVRPDIGDAAEVRRSVELLQRRLAAGEDRPAAELLVQEQVGNGIELALGIARDSSFGPLIMVAAGGVALDVWRDRRFLMAPVTARDAARTLRRLRIWPLLAGFRGAPPVDVAALERLVVALGRLAVDLPEVAELDLNPVIVRPDRVACVDVKLRLRARSQWRTTARALKMPPPTADSRHPATPARSAGPQPAGRPDPEPENRG